MIYEWYFFMIVLQVHDHFVRFTSPCACTSSDWTRHGLMLATLYMVGVILPTNLMCASYFLVDTRQSQTQPFVSKQSLVNSDALLWSHVSAAGRTLVPVIAIQPDMTSIAGVVSISANHCIVGKYLPTHRALVSFFHLLYVFL